MSITRGLEQLNRNLPSFPSSDLGSLAEMECRVSCLPARLLARGPACKTWPQHLTNRAFFCLRCPVELPYVSRWCGKVRNVLLANTCDTLAQNQGVHLAVYKNPPCSVFRLKTHPGSWNKKASSEREIYCLLAKLERLFSSHKFLCDVDSTSSAGSVCKYQGLWFL